MIKSKKQSFIVIGVFALVLMLGTVSYAFFNYTRTGTANTIRTGRIAFNASQNGSINLTNAFPIDRDDIDTDIDNVDEVVIEIEGDTDYENGIEYLVSSVDSQIYTSTGKKVPISIDITVTNLGTSNTNYFSARENANESIYNRMTGNIIIGDQPLLVGYIIPNDPTETADGIDGNITIKAFFDKDVIAISDTYDGNESDNNGTTNDWENGRTILTTSEWNTLQLEGVSFKIKVEANEGIWVEEPLYNIMSRNAVMDNISSTYVSSSSGVDFGTKSSDTNGKGTYIHAGTENDAYPMIYYRGDINNNNVVLGGFCWSAVRSTETGGIKLLYKGVSSPYYEQGVLDESHYSNVVNDVNNNFYFDSSDNTWNVVVDDNNGASIEFNVPSGNDYRIEVLGNTSPSVGGSIFIYKNGSIVNGNSGGDGSSININYSFGTIANSDVIKLVYNGSASSSANITIKFKLIGAIILVNDYSCNITSQLDSIIKQNINNTLTSYFAYNEYNVISSPAGAGYMYGTTYETSSSNWITNAKFGSDFTWNGSSYTLVDATKTAPDATHHYSCNSTDANATCSSIRYVYNINGNRVYYIVLTDGDNIEDAINKMNTNTNDSNAKSVIDTWYSENMTNYTNKLEDTIWCNDRRMSLTGNSWLPNGPLQEIYYMYYKSYERINVTHKLDFTCEKQDAFTVNNIVGNQKLTYPVALLTVDELVLSGGQGKGFKNYTTISIDSDRYMTMSPVAFGSTNVNFFYLHYNVLKEISTISGIRPAISLKQGTTISGGDGTVNNPYVIK